MTWRDKYHINKFHSYVNLDLNAHVSYLDGAYIDVGHENRQGFKQESKNLRQGKKRVVEHTTLRQKWEAHIEEGKSDRYQ